MASAEDQLKHEFRGEHWIVTDGGKSGFGARFSDRTFGVVQPGGHIIEMPFSYVKRVEVHRTYASTSKSTGGLSLTGALVGGALLGPAGMLLGGTTGKRTTKGKDYLTNLWIQIDMWGPGGGGAENFFLLKSSGPMFSETIMVKAEQVAAQATALVSRLIQIGSDEDRASSVSATSPSALAPPPPDPLLTKFETSAKSALERLGWRLKEHSPDCFVALKGDKRGVFFIDPKSGNAASVGRAFQRHRQFSGATSGAFIVGHLMLDGRREAERLGYKVLELRDLEQKAKRAPQSPVEMPRIEDAFSF